MREVIENKAIAYAVAKVNNAEIDKINILNASIKAMHLAVKKLKIMANTADISRGMILKLDGSLYSVVEFGENKTARCTC